VEETLVKLDVDLVDGTGRWGIGARRWRAAGAHLTREHLGCSRKRSGDKGGGKGIRRNGPLAVGIDPDTEIAKSIVAER